MDGLLQNENRINVNNLIKNPGSKAEGDILLYSNGDWVASPLRGKEIADITFENGKMVYTFTDGTYKEVNIPIW